MLPLHPSAGYLGRYGIHPRPTGDLLRWIHSSPGDIPRIGVCELTADAMAIVRGALNGKRHVIPRADNPNVPNWADNARSKAVDSDFLLQGLNFSVAVILLMYYRFIFGAIATFPLMV